MEGSGSVDKTSLFVVALWEASSKLFSQINGRKSVKKPAKMCADEFHFAHRNKIVRTLQVVEK